MTHIENKQDLVNWLEDNAPASTMRAVRDGRIELFGLFDPIPSSPNPGLIVQVTSAITNRIWYVVVSMQMKKPFYYAWEIKEPPWENWMGCWMGWRTNNPLYRGDDHDKCRIQYEMATARRR